MADNSITYKILVDKESGTATLRDFRGQIVATQVPIKELRKEFGNFAKEVEKVRFDKFNNSLKSTSKAKNDFSKASGGATSSVLELGRVIQDSNYGMRGMANNITQLASQMAFATKTAGSFRGALKDMGKAMLGPLGVVFAISVIVSIMERMEGSSQKAKKAIDSLNETFGEEATKLMVLKDALNDSNISLETKKELVSKANDEFKDLNISISDTGELSEEAAEKIDLLSMSFIKNAKARAIAKLIQDEMIEQSKIEARTAGENLKWYETAYYALINSIGGAGAGMADALEADSKNQEEALKSSKDTIQKYLDMLKKNDGELAKFIFGGNKKGRTSGKNKISIFKTKEDLDLDVKNQEQAILRLQEKIKIQNLKNREAEELANASTEKDKKRIKERYSKVYLEMELSNEKKRLELAKSTEKNIARAKHDEHVANLMRILEEYKLKIKLDKSISEAKKKELTGDAESKTRESILQSGKELSDTISQIDEAYEPLFSLYESLGEARRAAIGIGNGDKKQEEFDALSHYIETYKTLMSGVTDFVNGEFERQLQIEQNKTNALNEELNNRLLNENLSVKERKRIQNEIARNDEENRKKQNEIKKKQFNTQKAFNIAMAVVDTYAGASKALNDKTVPSTIARIALASATIASGLLQVATIARQKFQPEAASTPIRTASGGGGGGVGNRTFDFNLVGSSQGNQVAEAVQGQFDKPIKAYVVSKDITNQQQLDANTKSSARFGG